MFQEKKKSIDEYISTESFNYSTQKRLPCLAPVKLSVAPHLINKGLPSHSLFCNLLRAVNCGAIIKVTN